MRLDDIEQATGLNNMTEHLQAFMGWLTSPRPVPVSTAALGSIASATASYNITEVFQHATIIAQFIAQCAGIGSTCIFGAIGILQLRKAWRNRNKKD